MKSEFVEQVQLLMEIQQIKHNEQLFGKSNYMWLCSKKVSMIWMSTRDEYRIRQVLNKITPDQQVQIMKQLLTWLDDNPLADVLKIPEVALNLIHNFITNNLIHEANFSRMNSFRNSLRRFSVKSNKILAVPTELGAGDKPRRSVTFNDVPIIYRISK
ncbi:uncharacterized protein LOC108909382 [Anoplophora glabripennis]|uniref:uncharacterized protein LOC108909382 n=1 Tax=Anoplophora glabripennis TaxID=217634 RepID=UPI0008749E36|nr:uncharacterized protein LOC108909382 [Anoplophora glabripennis]